LEVDRGAAAAVGRRDLAEAALRAGDAVGACELAEAQMKAASSDGWARCCALLAPGQAASEASVSEVSVRADPQVASTMLPLAGIAQVPDWSAPYTPPPLRLLALRNWTALAPNVLVSRAGHLLDDHVGYPPSELWRHGVADFPGYVAAAGQIVLCERASQTVRLARPCFYLNASSNYAAWLMGDLPRLALLEQVRGVPIVLHGAVQDFHRASLALLGIDAAHVIEVAAGTRFECAQLYYVTSTYVHHAPGAHALNWLRVAVRRALGSGHRQLPLYLARRNYSAARPMLNEGALIAMLEGRGFLAIDAERHPLREQAVLAAAARLVVAPYGAALANALFAPPDAAALIIATKTQPEFARLLSLAGLPFAHVVAKPVKLRDGRNVSESYGYETNLAELTAVLDGSSLGRAG